MSPFSVPPATGGEISDHVLEHACIPAADRLFNGPLTNDQAALLQMTCAALFRETLNWRRKAGVIRELSLPENVTMLRAG